MNGQPLNRCDIAKLDALLRGTLSQDEAADVEAHLSGCRTCAERIQLAAVPETSWDEAQSLLSLDEFDGLSSLASASSLFPSDADDHVDSPTKDLLSREISGWLDPTDDPAMLGRFAGYEIVGIIGHGGMGIVLKGFERSLNRYVAIKILAPRLATNGSARKRFAREAQAAAAVRHDNVIAIHRVDEWHGLPFLTMPYVGGVSLQKRIDLEGPLSIEQTLRVGVQIAAGLAAAHAQGLVHRDIKPANILLEHGVERVTITDFGLARAADDASVTRTGVIAGTPQYMSPEQAEAKPLDARSDLFSLGSVLYVMATGRPPFRGEGSFDVLKRIVNEPARCMREIEPKVPEWFECVVNRLHAKSPDQRPQSAEAVAELLEDCLAHVQQPTTFPLPESVATLSAKQGNRPPLKKFIAAAAFAFSLIFAGVLIVLELNKGTLTIESDADNVPIRIKHNEDIVKRLLVSRDGTTTRLHAGQYTLEIDGPQLTYDVADGTVIVKRGATNIAKVTYAESNDHAAEQLTPRQSLSAAVIEFNNMYSKDGRGRPQQPLTQDEIIACLLWKLGNGELSDEVVAAVQAMLNTRERLMPAGWQLTGGLKRRRHENGSTHTWEVNLETDGLSRPISIRQTAISPPESMRTVSVTREGGIETIPLASVIESFNATWQNHDDFESTSHRALIHGLELPPLTIDEVLAAISLSLSTRDDGGMDDSTFQRLQATAATHRLPADVRFELIHWIKNDIDQWFTTSLIRMLVPSIGNSESPYLLTVRRQFIETDSNKPAATHWGKPDRNGLQAGVRLVPAQRTYQHGQVVDIEFLYRSTTSKKVPATLPATFQFGKVSGIRLERVSLVQPKWTDGSVHTLIGNEPVVVRGHRMQICFDSDEALKPDVNLKAITRPEANHYVRIAVPNPGDGAADAPLDISDRLFFSIPSLTPPKVLPISELHYYQHWGTSVPGYRRPEQSTPDPEFIDPFQIGVSLGPADKSQVPAYYSSGLQVIKVAPYSPADYVGIEVGDILLSWEGNQIYGDDPNKPFVNYNGPNNQLREALEMNAKSKGWATFNMDFDLLDHRSGEVIRISPWFGWTAGGSPNKAEVIRRLMERKRLREESSGK